MSLNVFINSEKSLLVAPAGYGKTHTLATCIGLCPDDKKQLILTHTHAGIASIKEKVKTLNIHPSKYHIETITGFIQKYVLAFCCESDLPKQDEPNHYDEFLKKALIIFKTNTVKRIIQASFQGIFVDEYQDCTISQHRFIIDLANILPIRILGDPLQGIFGFSEPLVSFETHLADFERFPPLTTPWRWNNQRRNDLGADLSIIRQKLIDGETIDLNSFRSIETIICNEKDWFKPRTEYRTTIERLLGDESLLFIHSNTTSVHPRLKMVKQFKNRFSLIESIDDKSFYEYAKLIDVFDFNESLIIQIKDVAYKLLGSKTDLDNWFNEKGFKRKNNAFIKQQIDKIQSEVDAFSSTKSYVKLSIILKSILKLSGIKCYRKELFYSICKALEVADADSITVFDAMTIYRNRIRRVGKKVLGKNIGTTLLTKGLEFDTVAIINAHKITDAKHFYVALTRASKRLVVFTESNTFKF